MAAIWGGHDLYLRWQEKRLVRRAMFDIEHGNERDASLAARSILEMKPSSARAARIMAQLAERGGERSALDWRRRVVQLDPHSVDDALALVRCAVQFSDIPTAELTLVAVDENSRNTASYHEASALVAQFKHQDEKAEAEWNEALRLRPDDKSFQLQLGMLRLRANETERRAAGEEFVIERAFDAPRDLMWKVWTDAEQIIDEIYPLYLAVAQTSAIRFEVFTREYFLEAGRCAPGKFRYFIWRQGCRAVAFSFCTIWNGTLYDNDIGLDYTVAYELNLYYVTFRDLLNWALANGLRRYASAPFSYDPKLRLRLRLQPVDVYVKHISPWLNPLIKVLALLFEPARTDPVLRRQRHLLR